MSQRSLSKVYDAIDAQNYKQALKLTDGLLKKAPNWGMACAMKALVLVRMDRRDEGMRLCAQLEEDCPTDEAVLSMMVHVHKSAGNAGGALRLYENAWAKEPDTVELAEGVFCCHARNGSYSAQHMVAMKMYKSFSDEKYLMWAVVSLLLQVQAGGEARLMQLAEMLLRRSKLLSEANIGLGQVKPEVCDLLLAVLQARGSEHCAALLAALSPGGALYGSLQPETERLKLVAQCNTRLEKHGEALAGYVELLKINPDDWSCLCGYIASYAAAKGVGGDVSSFFHPSCSLSLSLSLCFCVCFCCLSEGCDLLGCTIIWTAGYGVTVVYPRTSGGPDRC